MEQYFSFLGQQYHFPERIQIYNAVKNQADEAITSMYQRAMDAVNIDQLNKIDTIVKTYEDSVFKMAEKYAEKVVRWLCTLGIYQHNVSEVLARNKGFTSFKELYQEAAKIYSEIISAYLNGMQDDMNYAKKRAESTVTGSGTGIITNSIIDMFVYEFTERDLINKQAYYARQKFTKEMTEAEKVRHQRAFESWDNYVVTTYAKKAVQAAAEFGKELYRFFVNASIDAGIYAPEDRLFTDADQSNGYLLNLPYVSDDREILALAFQACPYNINLYSHIVNRKYLDDEIFLLINNFSLRHVLLKELENKISLLSKSNQKAKVIKENDILIANYAKLSVTKSKEDILGIILKDEEDMILTFFTNVKNAISKRDIADTVFELYGFDVYNSGVEQLEQLADKYIYNALIKAPTFEFGLVFENLPNSQVFQSLEVNNCATADAAQKKLSQSLTSQLYKNLKARQVALQKQRNDEISKKELERAEREKKQKKIKKTFTTIVGLIVVCGIVALLFIKVVLPIVRYKYAMSLKEDGNYTDAIEGFKKLENYKDSEGQIEICETAIKDEQYDVAIALMENGEYESAINEFESLDGYQDSKNQIGLCETALKDEKYDAAIALMDSGNDEAAITTFESLDGYRDSDEKIKEILSNNIELKIKYSNVGDIIAFGTYEQDNNSTNGKEDIEWIVLAKEGTEILVISEKALDCQPYNSLYAHVEWESCTLRQWLNDTFFNNAFSVEEQACIQSTSVSADTNPYYKTANSSTTDKVFLLSIAEFKEYFPHTENRACMPTAFALSNGGIANGSSGTCWWWLRTRGIGDTEAVDVDCGGNVNYVGRSTYQRNVCVRPAMWINLNGNGDEIISEIDTSEPELSTNYSNVGDIITFGTYEQDNNITNGKENIEWLVLAKVETETLVISAMALDCQQYNTSNADVSWSTCSLQNWLNDTFFNNAFSTEEQVQIKNSSAGKVFLLDVYEFKKYFSSTMNSACVPTAYAIANGAFVHSSKGTCLWWLREENVGNPMDIDHRGYVNHICRPVDEDDICVRPAMWINLDS